MTFSQKSRQRLFRRDLGSAAARVQNFLFNIAKEITEKFRAFCNHDADLQVEFDLL